MACAFKIVPYVRPLRHGRSRRRPVLALSRMILQQSSLSSGGASCRSAAIQIPAPLIRQRSIGVTAAGRGAKAHQTGLPTSSPIGTLPVQPRLSPSTVPGVHIPPHGAAQRPTVGTACHSTGICRAGVLARSQGFVPLHRTQRRQTHWPSHGSKDTGAFPCLRLGSERGAAPMIRITYGRDVEPDVMKPSLDRRIYFH